MSEDNFDQSQYTTFDFDWAGIGDEYQWVAIDGNGSCYVYTHMPEWSYVDYQWLHPVAPANCHHLFITRLYHPGGPDYLMKRPTATQACKHAELMLQYAQDAMVNEEPWELWERTTLAGEWETCLDHPMWRSGVDYRRKPQFVQMEVPAQHKEAVEAYIKQLEKSSG